MSVVLVTGGSSGIGRATAIAFARGGAQVAIASRGAERGHAVRDEIRKLGAECEFVQTDVARTADIERLFAFIRERFGRLDAAVNNAAAVDVGMFKETADFEENEFDGSGRRGVREDDAGSADRRAGRSRGRDRVAGLGHVCHRDVAHRGWRADAAVSMRDDA